MSRVQVETTKAINPTQLKTELGADIFTSEGIVQAEGVTQKQLEDAVAAHVANPNFGLTQDDIDLDAFLSKTNPTNAELIKAAKAMGRKLRGR